MTPLADEELVARALAAHEGDLRAFDELVRRHQAKVRTNCRYLTGEQEEALDLAQEVLVKAYFNLNRFEGRSKFGTWLGRIKVNHCLNHLRRKRGRRFLDVDDPVLEQEDALVAAERADGAAEAGDRRRLIAAVLDGMTPSLRVPLLMCDMDGLSYQEIADELDLGLSAVKMRIKRAREEFRAAFNRLDGVRE